MFGFVKFNIPVPEVFGHRCRVEIRMGDHGASEYRWVCHYCGSRGRWQSQSSEASVFQWFVHAYRSEGVTYPKGSAPAYKWFDASRPGVRR